MVSQEVQTVSSLLKGRTGLIGKFPRACPERISFVLDDGASLRLLGFESCHPSIIPEMGKKGVACFAIRAGKKRVPKKEWERLSGSANAVLFTKNGASCTVEILKRVDVTPPTEQSVAVFSFKRTGRTDTFIPVAG